MRKILWAVLAAVIVGGVVVAVLSPSDPATERREATEHVSQMVGRDVSKDIERLQAQRNFEAAQPPPPDLLRRQSIQLRGAEAVTGCIPGTSIRFTWTDDGRNSASSSSTVLDPSCAGV